MQPDQQINHSIVQSITDAIGNNSEGSVKQTEDITAFLNSIITTAIKDNLNSIIPRLNETPPSNTIEDTVPLDFEDEHEEDSEEIVEDSEEITIEGPINFDGQRWRKYGVSHNKDGSEKLYYRCSTVPRGN